MAKRRFQLPGVQDLSKEQEDARALPLEGLHLIIGGPGTGKSVLALLRARRLAQENKAYVFLVYNNLLHESSKQLFGRGLTSEQWQRWFYKTYTRHTDKQIQFLESDSNERGEVDWDTVLSEIKPASGVLPYLIIDEGQDMPPQFYRAIIRKFRYENVFVLADQNQQLKRDLNSSREDLEQYLVSESREAIELSINYRNTYSTARLAREFYTGDPASPPPELPQVSDGSVNTPLCYEYDVQSFDTLIGNILKTSDRDPSKLIGILTPDNEVRKRYYDRLLSSQVRLDNPKPQIDTYATTERRPINFNEGGVLVINGQACKGLEFDIVFIADINSFDFDATDSSKVDEIKKLFYVMTARAVDKVILLKQRGRHCPVDSILPFDRTILERK